MLKTGMNRTALKHQLWFQRPFKWLSSSSTLNISCVCGVYLNSVTLAVRAHHSSFCCCVCCYWRKHSKNFTACYTLYHSHSNRTSRVSISHSPRKVTNSSSELLNTHFKVSVCETTTVLRQQFVSGASAEKLHTRPEKLTQVQVTLLRYCKQFSWTCS